MPCTFCNRDLKIVGRGYCKACYQRWHKRGTVEYAERHRTFCQIDDCGKPVVSNGLCDMHRNRLRKHGHLEQTRPDSWGAKHKHPLFHSWAWMRRHRGKHPMSDVWANDFLQFAMDVGSRPSAKHKLFAADETRPIGPDNYVWKEAITQRVAGEDEKTYMNRAQKIYRAVRKEAFQGYGLKKRFGIGKAEYDEMAKAQNHVCAICGMPETAIVRGSRMNLAVDHCHEGGHVRGLLCGKCNTGLGNFRDSVGLLRKAIAYLNQHKPI